MHVPAIVPFVFISESARSFTEVLHCFPFDRIIKYLSVLADFTVFFTVVHHISPENLSTFIALGVEFTFF
jgi:hypothetical protein